MSDKQGIIEALHEAANNNKDRAQHRCGCCGGCGKKECWHCWVPSKASKVGFGAVTGGIFLLGPGVGMAEEFGVGLLSAAALILWNVFLGAVIGALFVAAENAGER